MREYLNEDTTAGTVRMLRSTFTGSFLLVEGDVDARFFRRFIDGAACVIVVCFGRSTVIGTVKALDRSGFIGHVGVIDSDHAPLLGERIDSNNIILTEENDIETMVFCSDAFERFVAEYGNVDRVEGVRAVYGKDLRDVILEQAGIIGIIRLLSKQKAWNIKFDGASVKYVERRTLTIDLEAQINHFRGRSLGHAMPANDVVRAEIVAAEVKVPVVLARVCGHDVCEIISKGAHQVFGRAHHLLGRGGAAVEEVLRAAFSSENFSMSAIYKKIREWEGRTPPYRVLPT